MEHLVYCDKKADELNKLISGDKTMIIRGAAGRKLPYGRVNKGEKLFFCINDGSQTIKAEATVKSVINSEKLTPEQSQEMIEKHQKCLNLTPTQYKRWNGKKYLCLIEVEKVNLLNDIKYDRQSNMDDWITVEKIEDILDGSNKKYQSVRI